MRRRVLWAGALTLLVAFVVFDFVSTLSTCQQIERQENEKRAEESCGFAQSLTYAGAEIAFEWVDRRHDFVTAAATLVIAFFTFTLWRATDKMWDAGERQLEHLAETSERQLCAYVFPVEAVLTNFDVGHPVECKIVIKNSGQTPAYRLTHAAIIGLANFPPEGSFPECDASQATSRTNLGPGAPLDKFGERSVPLSADEFGRLQAGTAALYLFGRIDFVDAFKRPRWVKYRYMTGGTAGIGPKGRLAICEDGNETSEG